MKKNILHVYVVLFYSLLGMAQIDHKLIHGKVLHRLEALPNVHIVNTTTNKATFSNDAGEFNISARPSDMLRLSYVGYETKFIILERKHFRIQKNIFVVEKITYTLDEIKLRQHNLFGTITTDVKETPIDYKEGILLETMDLSDIDMTIVEAEDHIDKMVRPKLVKSDPISLFDGAGTSVNLPFGHSKKLWKLREELALKKGMPVKLMKELGAKFFFIDLGIPAEKYYHFLSYCNPKGIEKLYKKGKKLAVIKILQQESKSYLKVIESE